MKTVKTYVCNICQDRSCVVCKTIKSPVVPELCPCGADEAKWHEVKEADQ